VKDSRTTYHLRSLKFKSFLYRKAVHPSRRNSPARGGGEIRGTAFGDRVLNCALFVSGARSSATWGEDSVPGLLPCPSRGKPKSLTRSSICVPHNLLSRQTFRNSQLRTKRTPLSRGGGRSQGSPPKFHRKGWSRDPTKSIGGGALRKRREISSVKKSE